MATTTAYRLSELEKAVRDVAYVQLQASRNGAQFSAEMLEFKQEMRAFKDETGAFKDEMRAESTEMNRLWWDVVDRLGTIVEDIVAPGIPGVLRRHFGVDEPEIVMIRVRKRHPDVRSRRREFDVIATSPGVLYLNETKATMRPEYMERFIREKDEVFDYFPEYRGRDLVPIMSSLSLTDEAIAWLSEYGCYAMMIPDEVMDIVNADQVVK